MGPENQTKVILPVCAQSKQNIKIFWISRWQIVYGRHVIPDVFTVLTLLKFQPSFGMIVSNAGDPSLTVYVLEVKIMQR
jgi:hypothetical protein